MARPAKIDRVLFAQEQNAALLATYPNVLGVATGRRIRGGELTDEICVQVFVERKVGPELLADRQRVPANVVGYAEEAIGTDVIEITLPQAHQDTTRYRPVPGGCSIGPESSISAGTLGGWAGDNTDDTVALLTNNHVISNLDTMPAARRVLQPGRFDGGILPGDVIGSLKRDVPLATIPFAPTPPNPPVTAVDAAIGSIDVDRTDQVLQIGPAIYELQAPAVNMNVQKRGRTTRLTTNGRIFSVNGTFNVSYRNQTRLGRIANSFLIRSTDGNVFSAAGDSGSLIFNQQRGTLEGTFPVVGLLYAGGTMGDGAPFTLACDINAVFGALNLTTVCNLAVRVLLRAIFRDSAAGREASDRFLAAKEAQLRRLRSRIFPRTGFGKSLEEFIATRAAFIASAVMGDEETFGLAVKAVAPWVRKPTNLEVLQTPLDAEAVGDLSRLADRLARQVPELRPQLTALRSVVGELEGATVAQVLRRAKLEVRGQTKG